MAQNYSGLLVLFFLVIYSYCPAQRQYEFDYLIEYNVTFYQDIFKIKNRPFHRKDKTFKKFYLTNSKNNNYLATISILDSSKYYISFKDEDGLVFKDSIDLNQITNKNYILVDCRKVSNYSNPYKYLVKEHEFVQLSDTILNGLNYMKYKLTSKNSRKIKRKKLGTQFYIIDKQTAFHLPILPFSTAYEEWKQDGNLSNGIFYEKYFIDYYGSLDSKEQLVNYTPVSFKILLPANCDYTID